MYSMCLGLRALLYPTGRGSVRGGPDPPHLWGWEFHLGTTTPHETGACIGEHVLCSMRFGSNLKTPGPVHVKQHALEATPPMLQLPAVGLSSTARTHADGRLIVGGAWVWVGFDNTHMAELIKNASGPFVLLSELGKSAPRAMQRCYCM